ncbi:MAG: ribosome maturation factor RimM [Methylohalobius sp.]
MVKRIAVGEIRGAFGIKGWVKIYSYTEPRENVLAYSPWELEHQGKRWKIAVLTGRRQGRTVVAALDGVTTPEQAQALRGAKISIDRAQLPQPAEGEFYWVDLIGLTVIDLSGRQLGQVVDLMETGANDVLIVRAESREILIPWLREQVVREVDFKTGTIQVDWDPDY